jgi:signal transduction histidine kinase
VLVQRPALENIDLRVDLNFPTAGLERLGVLLMLRLYLPFGFKLLIFVITYESTLAVSDVGSGIPEYVADKLFTPFFTTKAEGMGLGLSLCRTVVEQHGGFLSHRANQPRGTVFSFTLPQS